MGPERTARGGDFPPLRELDTRELLSRARAGDAQSMGQLLTLYRNYLTIFASTQLQRRLRRRLSPSDIVQETMLQAHRHFAQFQGESEQEFLAWLRQVLLSSLSHFVERHILAAKRNIRREVPIEESAMAARQSRRNEQTASGSPGETPSALVRQREAAAILSARLAKLPPAYRAVLTLRHMEELPFDEIAVRLHRTPAAARMLWLRAIQKLRTIYGGTGEHDA
ncbi:MAG TPA: sigma-70 family RNA polymerase sigma factor [Pirellulaceae bacterium]|jgi:RNA polymerase sigma-70 factor (ECF subfamily)